MAEDEEKRGKELSAEDARRKETSVDREVLTPVPVPTSPSCARTGEKNQSNTSAARGHSRSTPQNASPSSVEPQRPDTKEVATDGEEPSAAMDEGLTEMAKAQIEYIQSNFGTLSLENSLVAVAQLRNMVTDLKHDEFVRVQSEAVQLKEILEKLLKIDKQTSSISAKVPDCSTKADLQGLVKTGDLDDMLLRIREDFDRRERDFLTKTGVGGRLDCLETKTEEASTTLQERLQQILTNIVPIQECATILNDVQSRFQKDLPQDKQTPKDHCLKDSDVSNLMRACISISRIDEYLLAKQPVEGLAAEVEKLGDCRRTLMNDLANAIDGIRKQRTERASHTCPSLTDHWTQTKSRSDSAGAAAREEGELNSTAAHSPLHMIDNLTALKSASAVVNEFQPNASVRSHRSSISKSTEQRRSEGKEDADTSEPPVGSPPKSKGAETAQDNGGTDESAPTANSRKVTCGKLKECSLKMEMQLSTNPLQLFLTDPENIYLPFNVSKSKRIATLKLAQAALANPHSREIQKVVSKVVATRPNGPWSTINWNRDAFFNTCHFVYKLLLISSKRLSLINSRSEVESFCWIYWCDLMYGENPRTLYYWGPIFSKVKCLLSMDKQLLDKTNLRTIERAIVEASSATTVQGLREKSDPVTSTNPDEIDFDVLASGGFDILGLKRQQTEQKATEIGASRDRKKPVSKAPQSPTVKLTEKATATKKRKSCDTEKVPEERPKKAIKCPDLKGADILSSLPDGKRYGQVFRNPKSEELNEKFSRTVPRDDYCNWLSMYEDAKSAIKADLQNMCQKNPTASNQFSLTKFLKNNLPKCVEFKLAEGYIDSMQDLSHSLVSLRRRLQSSKVRSNYTEVCLVIREMPWVSLLVFAWKRAQRRNITDDELIELIQYAIPAVASASHSWIVQEEKAQIADELNMKPSHIGSLTKARLLMRDHLGLKQIPPGQYVPRLAEMREELRSGKQIRSDGSPGQADTKISSIEPETEEKQSEDGSNFGSESPSTVVTQSGQSGEDESGKNSRGRKRLSRAKPVAPASSANIRKTTAVDKSFDLDFGDDGDTM